MTFPTERWVIFWLHLTTLYFCKWMGMWPGMWYFCRCSL